MKPLKWRLLETSNMRNLSGEFVTPDNQTLTGFSKNIVLNEIQ